MFVRVKKTPNSPRRSVQIVRSKRVDGKVRQTIVRHVGVANDDEQLEALKRLGRRMIAEWEIDANPGIFAPAEQERQLREIREDDERSTPSKESLLVDLRDLQEEERAVRGIHEVYGRVYDSLGLGNLLPPIRDRSANRILREIVMARLAQPTSERRSVRHLSQRMGTRLGLEKIYRMMDRLHEDHVEQLNRLAAKCAADLLEPPLDMYFFNCTTLRFESFVVDAQKAPGYNKDTKFKDSQVLLALTVTPDGLPVHHRVLLDQTFEGKNLRGVVDDFRRHVPLRRAVVVAERGMLSRTNQESLREADIHYIVGEALPNHLRKMREAALDPDRSGPPTTSDQITEIDDGVDRLVGQHGIRTSLRDLAADEVISAYTGLQQVEQAFRVSKHDLRVHPIFHWTPRRIHAHIAIAFMALLCLRHLEYRCAL